MAWTAPMTAVAGNAFSAAQFNTYVRDNLLETAPAKATTAGSYFVATGSHSIAERAFVRATNFTDTGSTTATDFTPTLTSGGTNPSVTVTTGSRAIVIIGAQMTTAGTITGGSGTIWCVLGYAVSGATTIAATEDEGMSFRNTSGFTGESLNTTRASFLTSLTPGSNTFTLQYKTAGSATTPQANYTRRSITVVPF